MNPFSAIGSFFAAFFRAGERAEEERKQEGLGSAYSEALRKATQDYYNERGTFRGFDYEEFDAKWDKERL